MGQYPFPVVLHPLCILLETITSFFLRAWYLDDGPSLEMDVVAKVLDIIDVMGSTLGFKLNTSKS